MNADIDFWRLAAGLGLFLYGMQELEAALSRLAGRSFKRFLQQQTARPVKAVVTGALTTAALQSSSVVGLIVLAFVGTGVISLASAIGVIFGSNLGTTATGWLVVTLGFKLDIQALALPLVAVGGLAIVWSESGTRRWHSGHLAVGIGLMLIGLAFMKEGTESAAAFFDPGQMANYPPIAYVAIGLLLTAVIQSSSATIMITLSTLHAGVITLPSAAAIAIGANLGTTITILLGALAGSAAKKRVAFSHVLFNAVTDTIAFILLYPLLTLITGVLAVSDPLFALVAFHSFINLMGIVLFTPFTGPLSRRLGRMFREEAAALLRHVRPDEAAVPEAAIEAMRHETCRLIDQAAALNLVSFGLEPKYSFYDSGEDRSGVPIFRSGGRHSQGYEQIKQLEGAITEYALALQQQALEPEASARLGQIFPAIRNAVHSAKSIRDTHHDLETFLGSANDAYNAYFRKFRDNVDEFYALFESLRGVELPALRFERLVALKRKNDELHSAMHADIYRDVTADRINETEISTLFNVNRELHNSNQALLNAIADAILDMQTAAEYRAVPATH